MQIKLYSWKNEYLGVFSVLDAGPSAWPLVIHEGTPYVLRSGSTDCYVEWNGPSASPVQVGTPEPAAVNEPAAAPQAGDHPTTTPPPPGL